MTGIILKGFTLEGDQEVSVRLESGEVLVVSLDDRNYMYHESLSGVSFDNFKMDTVERYHDGHLSCVPVFAGDTISFSKQNDQCSFTGVILDKSDLRNKKRK